MPPEGATAADDDDNDNDDDAVVFDRKRNGDSEGVEIDSAPSSKRSK